MPRVVYGIDDRPPLSEALALGFQHVSVMLLGNVTPALLISLALGLPSAETTYLVQMALVLSGLATLVQAHPVGPVGAGLPVVMGTSVVFVGGMVVTWPDVPWTGLLVAVIGVTVIVPIVFHPISRMVWVAGERHFHVKAHPDSTD